MSLNWQQRGPWEAAQRGMAVCQKKIEENRREDLLFFNQAKENQLPD